MKRKDFLQLSAIEIGCLVLPGFPAFGNPIDPLQALNERMDVAEKSN